MEKYDVIIVGGGPAGLRCAEILGESDKKILLLEKNQEFGDKVCAGGITRKDLEIFDVPDEVIEHKIVHSALHSPKRSKYGTAHEPVVFMINRKEFGAWQKKRIHAEKIKIATEEKVVKIESNKIITKSGKEYGYTNLVGADGSNSVVRRHLNIPVEKVLIGIQYSIPVIVEEPRLEIFMDASYFHSGYAWIFPHRNSISVGCTCNPKRLPARKLKENFHAWLNKKGFDISNATYQSCPISFDYRGIKFGNTFLAGDAAGLASGFTGEGIFQALVSGEAAARMILDKNHISGDLEYVLRYNRIQNKIMWYFSRSGPLKNLIFEAVLIALKNKYFVNKVNSSFS